MKKEPTPDVTDSSDQREGGISRRRFCHRFDAAPTLPLPLFPPPLSRSSLKTRNEPVHIPVPNDLDAKPGDLVELTETSSFLIQLSAIQYGIPGLGFVTGLLIGYFLHPQSLSMPLELYQFFLGLGGLVLGGFIGYKWAKSLASKPEKFYRMERVL